MKTTTNNFDAQVENYTQSELKRNEQLRSFMRGQTGILILGGYGERLAVKFKCLYVYGLEQEPRILQPGIHGIKQIVYILAIGDISMAALHWIKKEKIQLMIIDQHGESRLTSGIETKSIALRTHQYGMSQSDKVAYSRYILKQKILQQASTLKKHAAILQQAEHMAQELCSMVAWFDLTDIPWLQKQQQLMQLEAKCAQAYFLAWKSLPVKWAKSNTHQVKTLGYDHYNNRHDHSHVSARNAHHPVNTLLNFAYGLAEQRVKLACVARGLEIGVSFLHAQHEDRDNLVYDLIEPVRGHVDDLVLSYLTKNALMLGDFSIENSGVVKLTPHFAKVFAAYIASHLDNALIHNIIEEYCNFLLADETVQEQEQAA